MVYLEDSQRRRGVRIAIPERIEASAQNHVLCHAAANRSRQFVFGETTADHQECPKGTGDTAAMFVSLDQSTANILADDSKRQGIVEDLGIVEELVRRAPSSNAQRRSARPGLPHSFFIRVNCLPVQQIRRSTSLSPA
jgi:hypothetical protein